MLKQWLDITESVLKILAILVGTAWAYFKYFRGRTYRPRLEMDIDGSVLRGTHGRWLRVVVTLKNVGLSKVTIEQRGTGLLVLGSKEPSNNGRVSAVEWEDLGVFEVFQKHAWVEPGEVIVGDQLLTLPKPEHIAYQAGVRVVSHHISWQAMTIVPEDIYPTIKEVQHGSEASARGSRGHEQNRDRETDSKALGYSGG